MKIVWKDEQLAIGIKADAIQESFKQVQQGGFIHATEPRKRACDCDTWNRWTRAFNFLKENSTPHSGSWLKSDFPPQYFQPQAFKLILRLKQVHRNTLTCSTS